MVQVNLLTGRRQTRSLRQQAMASRGRMREGIVRGVGMDRGSLLYLRWITSKDLLDGTWNSAQCFVVARMREESGGEWIHGWMAESLHCSPETVTSFVHQLYPNTIFKV